jgi:hypothetical protein
MAKANKTQVTAASPEAFVAALTPDSRRADAAALSALMSRISGEPARMWGPSIVGFGVRRYRYESGREGETPRLGFSPRKEAFVIYGLGDPANDARVAALGKVTTGKGCVYFKRLADIDLGRLEALLASRL